MTFNPHAATVDEMRDWLAKREGWTHRGDRWRHPKWHRLGSGQKRHPIPATLDWVAKATEDTGCAWIKTLFKWSAWSMKVDSTLDPTAEVPITGDEYTDRLRLLCLVLMAEDASKGKGNQ